MRLTFIDVKKRMDIKEIREVLMSSDGVSCDKELYESELHSDKRIYRLLPPAWSACYSVTVDYNKLAEAIYDAGFRKADKEHDTLVCLAVKKDPLAFVDILREQAEVADKGECKSQDVAPLMREAACIIANLLLTEDDWHETAKEEHQQ